MSHDTDYQLDETEEMLKELEAEFKKKYIGKESDCLNSPDSLLSYDCGCNGYIKNNAKVISEYCLRHSYVEDCQKLRKTLSNYIDKFDKKIKEVHKEIDSSFYLNKKNNY